MSRRYGRNQKHVHRTQIADLERQVVDLTNDAAMWKQRAELSVQKACRAEEILAIVVRDIEEVAYHSALLPPKESGIEMSEDADRVMLPLREKPDWADLVQRPPTEKVTINTIALWRIRTLVREVPMFRKILHLRFRAGQEVAYAITDEVLAYMVESRGPVYAVQEILKVMLEQIRPAIHTIRLPHLIRERKATRA